MRRLNPSISHPLPVIDPYLDSTRDEGESRHTLVRTVLRLFASATQTARLVDPESDGSYGAYLAARRGAAHGHRVLEAILNVNAEPKAAVCLVMPTTRLLTPEQADALSPQQRQLCIPVARAETIALPLSADPGADAMRPQVCVHFDQQITGGTRRARMELERVGADGLAINMVSASGARKYLTTKAGQTLPLVVLDKLFAPCKTPPMCGEETGPTRKNVLPDYARAALVAFLERRVRLQVLCTALAGVAVPLDETLPPRPVVLDGAKLVEFDAKHKSWLAIKATLHASATTCICRAHGLRFHSGGGRVEVVAETCGRPLQDSGKGDGSRVCPCHKDAVDKHTGSARFAVGDRCTEATRIAITCWHQDGAACRRGVRIDNVALSDADRLELATLLVNIEEFEGRTAKYFSKQWAINQPRIAKHTIALESKLRERMEQVELDQLQTEDPSVCNPKTLLQRDMMAVDLMRGGGVFRHVVKRGGNRGKPYIARHKRNDDTPTLEPHEADIVNTHGHLFRCAK